jgi:hypothetical protein
MRDDWPWFYFVDNSDGEAVPCRVCKICGAMHDYDCKRQLESFWSNTGTQSCPACAPSKGEEFDSNKRTSIYAREQVDAMMAYKRVQLSEATAANTDLRRQLAEAKDARIVAQREAADLLTRLAGNQARTDNAVREAADKHERMRVLQAELAEAKVARITPVWTDGPPDRVGPWLREHDGGCYAINVVERDLTPPRIWDPSRWLYLGDYVEGAKP